MAIAGTVWKGAQAMYAQPDDIWIKIHQGAALFIMIEVIVCTALVLLSVHCLYNHTLLSRKTVHILLAVTLADLIITSTIAACSAIRSDWNCLRHESHTNESGY